MSGTGREGIRFPDSNAQMGHAMKPHEVCAGTKSLETLTSGFPPPVAFIEKSRGLCSPSSGSQWGLRKAWIPPSPFMSPASFRSEQNEVSRGAHGALGSPPAPHDTCVHSSSPLPADCCSRRPLLVCARFYRSVSQPPLPHKGRVAPSSVHLTREDMTGKGRKRNSKHRTGSSLETQYRSMEAAL